MAVDDKHPQYTSTFPDWKVMDDTYGGERVIKGSRFEYLPATSGMIADGVNTNNTVGYEAYQAYLTRAHFPDIVKKSVKAMLGTMWHKPPTIKLPAKLEPLRERATLKGEPLEFLLRQINQKQLIFGRCGTLIDMPSVPSRSNRLPYIVLYNPERIINWDAGRRDGIALENLNLVVLDESEHERKEDFTWEWINKYRVLVLGDVDQNEPQGQGTYRTFVVRKTTDSKSGNSFDIGEAVEPNIRGKTLKTIPFTFINDADIITEPTEPPLLGLAKLNLTIYRGEADYRQSLFMQGQDTLVIIGQAPEDDFAIGAGRSIKIPMAGGDAKFIGVDSQGLSEQREALSNDYGRALEQAGSLLDSLNRERESGDALKTRVGAKTATLNQIALAGAYGLEQTLKQIADWVEADPNEVSVVPNLDFSDGSITGDDMQKVIAAAVMGLPLSQMSIHSWLKDNDVTKMTYEEELAQIEKEEPLVDPVTAPSNNNDG